jgi:hypothetical protein
MTTPGILLMLAASLVALPASAFNTSEPNSKGEHPTESGDIAAEIHQTFLQIAEDLRALKSKYPQLEGTDQQRADGAAHGGLLITYSQLSYDNGTIHCGNKAKPCEFSSPSACDISVSLQQIKTREEAGLHQAVSEVYALSDGTYLEIECHISAAPTRQGGSFSARVGHVVAARVDALRKRLGAAAKAGKD